MKSFQTLFPPLAPQTLSLSSARRVVLVSYNADRGTVDFRHYVITVKPYGISRRVRRVLEGATTASSEKASRSSRILDLGNENDVADFLLRKRGESVLDGGYESAASSAESIAGDEGDAVSLAEDYVGRNNKKGQKRAVRLDEVGPRMELRLVKITEGVPGKDGSVIFHQYGLFSLTLFHNYLNIVTVKKSKKEVATLTAEHAAKEKLRKERREQQELNVQRKRESAQDPEDDQATDASVEDDEGEAEDNEMWDEEDEVTDGEEESSEDEELQRPTKKARMRDKL